MGLIDEVRRHNTTETGSQFIDPKGRPFAKFPLTDGSSASLTSEYEILRGDLAKVLYEATKDFPNVDCLFGTTIKKVLSNDENAVKVELSNGKIQQSDLLVAADGQWSKIRKQCFPADSVGVVDKGMYVTYFTVPRLAGDNDWWNIYHGLKSRIITTRPDPYGTIRAMLTMMPSTDSQKRQWEEASKSGREAQEALLKKEFADGGWQAQRLLESMSQAADFYFQVVQQIKMSKWSTGRVICLGDTAYAPTPLTGMGTSLAILGAYVLAGELSVLKAGEHPSKALDAYETAFRPFVEDSQSIPPFIPDVAFPRTAFKRWLLQSFVSGVAKIVAIPWIRKRMGDSQNEENFDLPRYSAFEDEVDGVNEKHAK